MTIIENRPSKPGDIAAAFCRTCRKAEDLHSLILAGADERRAPAKVRKIAEEHDQKIHNGTADIQLNHINLADYSSKIEKLR
jgi:hypothetical protein